MAPSAPTMAREPARVPEVVEVRDRLAHREEALLQVELAAEQHRDEVGGADRRVRGGNRRDELGEPRGVVRAQLRDPHARCPRNGSPCDGSTSVSGGSVSKAASESRKRAERIAVGLGRGQTLTLVLILGSSMSPEMQHARARANGAPRAQANGRDPSMHAPDAPPAIATSSPSTQAIERRGQFGHAAPILIAAPVASPTRARRPSHAGERARTVGPGAEARVLGRRSRAPSGIRPGSSRPARRIAPPATRRCPDGRDGSAWRRCAEADGRASVVAKWRSQSARVATSP